jgi:hypothetical protein
VRKVRSHTCWSRSRSCDSDDAGERLVADILAGVADLNDYRRYPKVRARLVDLIREHDVAVLREAARREAI